MKVERHHHASLEEVDNSVLINSMTKATKIIIGISTCVLVGLGAYLFYFLNKKKGSGGKMDANFTGKWQSPSSYMSNTTDGYYPIHLAIRPPSGTFAKGDTVTIDGDVPFAGEYTANRTWDDDNGNIGAVYVSLKGYVPNGKNDKSYSGKATIKIT